jgi:hypothetical protein
LGLRTSSTPQQQGAVAIEMPMAFPPDKLAALTRRPQPCEWRNP